MEIIAHRGLVAGPQTPLPHQLTLALELGFGIEFDVRDAATGIVLAHDPWTMSAEPLEHFLPKIKGPGTLAINIKSCGLAARLKEILQAHSVSLERCFFFDMAIPDHLLYLKHGLPAYLRLSEVEPVTPLMAKSPGVWLDGFESIWWDVATLESLLQEGRKVCIVSPDLHRRDRYACWKFLKEAGLHRSPRLALCTDFSLEARDYFAV
jgi:hypothetical protein